MTEATGFEAKTIHRLLEVDPKGGGFKRGDDNPLHCDLLVVDETSMVDVMLMQTLMRAVPDKATLLRRNWLLFFKSSTGKIGAGRMGMCRAYRKPQSWADRYPRGIPARR